MGKTTWSGPIDIKRGGLMSRSLSYFEDFIGPGMVVVPAAASAESGSAWVKKIVGAAPPTVAGVADAAGGVIACTLTSASQKQDAEIYHDDQRNFDITKQSMIEFRIKPSVLPTGTAIISAGLASDWVDGHDAITHSVWVRMAGSGLILCEMDDNATDRSASSGVTLTASDWAVVRIDFLNITDVKFYIGVNGADPTRVAATTGFNYAATGANAILQPFFGGYKASGTDVGTLQLDYFRAWQGR